MRVLLTSLAYIKGKTENVVVIHMSLLARHRQQLGWGDTRLLSDKKWNFMWSEYQGMFKLRGEEREGERPNSEKEQMVRENKKKISCGESTGRVRK